MKFSCFARYGNGLRFSSKKPLGQRLYEQIVQSNGGVYQSEVFAGPNVGRWFALAMMVSRARMTLERAGNQTDPLKLWDLLTTIEKTYALTPAAIDTLADRRRAIAAAEQLLLGPKRGNVEYQLRTALGDDFVAWVTDKASNGVGWPTLAGVSAHAFPDNPETIGRFDNPSTWQTIELTDDVDFTGTPVTRHWLTVAGEQGQLAEGDTLVVAPGLTGQQELIMVASATDSTITTTFARPHEAGTLAIRRPWPSWFSTQKHSLVVVKNGRARDQALRSKADALLSRLLGGTSTWDIVEENSTPGASGPCLPNQAQPGITPIKTWTY